MTLPLEVQFSGLGLLGLNLREAYTTDGRPELPGKIWDLWHVLPHDGYSKILFLILWSSWSGV